MQRSNIEGKQAPEALITMKGNDSTSKKQEGYYKSHGNNKGSSRKSYNNALKVKYISSPMRVKTTASRFQSLVQQLTGKNSDAEQYVADDRVENVYNAANDDFHKIGSYIKTGRSYEDCQVRVFPSGFSTMNPSMYFP